MSPWTQTSFRERSEGEHSFTSPSQQAESKQDNFQGGHALFRTILRRSELLPSVAPPSASPRGLWTTWTRRSIALSVQRFRHNFRRSSWGLDSSRPRRKGDGLMVFVGGASHKSSSLKAQKGAALKDDANNLGHRTRMGHGMAADATQASRRAR